MGKSRAPEKVMLFAGLLYCDNGPLSAAIDALREAFGPLLFETAPAAWHSGYYADEFGGTEVKRKFLFFEKLICPGQLADIKLTTNGIESSLSGAEKRKVNIDPGYITPARIVLASTKDYAHRVYLQKGVYAEVTMLWSRKERTFMPHLFTYTDFRDEENVRIFSKMRDALQSQLPPGQRPFSDCK